MKTSGASRRENAKSYPAFIASNHRATPRRMACFVAIALRDEVASAAPPIPSPARRANVHRSAAPTQHRPRRAGGMRRAERTGRRWDGQNVAFLQCSKFENGPC